MTLRRKAIFVILMLLAVPVFWLLRFWLTYSAPDKSIPTGDPRLTFGTPFRNVRPEVRYVGDERCADCHLSHTESFRQHPMGRSLAPAVAAPLERYDAA